MKRFEVENEYVVSFGNEELTFKCIDRDLENVNLKLVKANGEFDFAKRPYTFEALQYAVKTFNGDNYLTIKCDSLGEYEYVALADLAHICA